MNRLGIIIGNLLLGLVIFVLLLAWSRLPNQLPWFYSLPWGEGQLINKYWFAGGIGILGGLFLLDILISKWLSKQDGVLASVIIWFGVAVVTMYVASVFQVLTLML